MSKQIEGLETAPMSGLQIRAVATTGMLNALDGYDILAMTFAAPGVSAAWGIDRTQLGLALSSGLVGMMVGSLLFAPFADRVGRRPVAILCLGLMGFGMLMAAFSRSVPELAIWRVITGVGIGTMVPIIAPLASEYANARYRRFAVAVMALGYPVGGTIGGFAAALLLKRFDWPVVFIVGAIAATVMMVPTLLWLIEPPAYLILKRPRHALARVNAYLVRCGQPPLDELPNTEDRPASASYREIFKSEYRTDTVLITVINLLFMMTVYYLLSWMPQLIAERGHSHSFAALVASMACLSGTAAGLILNVIGQRIPLRWLVAVQMAGLSVTAMLFTTNEGGSVTLLLLASLLGVFLYSGTAGLYSAIVSTFNPIVRSTGAGFVMGVGRGAAAIAPALAGFLFTLGFGPMAVTAILAAGSLAAAVLMAARPHRHEN